MPTTALALAGSLRNVGRCLEPEVVCRTTCTGHSSQQVLLASQMLPVRCPTTSRRGRSQTRSLIRIRGAARSSRRCHSRRPSPAAEARSALRRPCGHWRCAAAPPVWTRRRHIQEAASRWPCGRGGTRSTLGPSTSRSGRATRPWSMRGHGLRRLPVAARGKASRCARRTTVGPRKDTPLQSQLGRRWPSGRRCRASCRRPGRTSRGPLRPPGRGAPRRRAPRGMRHRRAARPTRAAGAPTHLVGLDIAIGTMRTTPITGTRTGERRRLWTRRRWTC